LDDGPADFLAIHRDSMPRTIDDLECVSSPGQKTVGSTDRITRKGDITTVCTPNARTPWLQAVLDEFVFSSEK